MSGAAGIRAGQAHILLRIRDRTSAGLTTAFRSIQKFSLQVGKIGLALQAAAAPVGLILGGAIKQFANAEQLFGRFESVFGKFSKDAERFAIDFAGKIGQSSVNLKDQLAQFQAVFRGFGFSGELSTELSKELTAMTQDLIAFDDTITNQQDAVDKLLGGLTGSNIRGVRSFGADITEASLQAELFAQGITKSVKEADQQEKLLARINILRKAALRSGVTGQAIREAKTLAAQFRAIQAALRDVRIEIGRALAPATAGLAAVFGDALRETQAWIIENPRFVQSLALATTGVFVLGTAFLGLSAASFAAGRSLILLRGIITGFGIFSSIFNPATYIILGLAAAVALGITNFKELKNIALNVASSLSRTFASSIDNIKQSFIGIENALSAGDITLAAKIGAQAIKIEYAKLVILIKKELNKIPFFFDSVNQKVVAGVFRTRAAIEKLNLTTGLKAASVSGQVGDAITPAAMAFNTFNVEVFAGIQSAGEKMANGLVAALKPLFHLAVQIKEAFDGILSVINKILDHKTLYNISYRSGFKSVFKHREIKAFAKALGGIPDAAVKASKLSPFTEEQINARRIRDEARKRGGLPTKTLEELRLEKLKKAIDLRVDRELKALESLFERTSKEREGRNQENLAALQAELKELEDQSAQLRAQARDLAIKAEIERKEAQKKREEDDQAGERMTEAITQAARNSEGTFSSNAKQFFGPQVDRLKEQVQEQKKTNKTLSSIKDTLDKLPKLQFQ